MAVIVDCVGSCSSHPESDAPDVKITPALFYQLFANTWYQKNPASLICPTSQYPPPPPCPICCPPPNPYPPDRSIAVVGTISSPAIPCCCDEIVCIGIDVAISNGTILPPPPPYPIPPPPPPYTPAAAGPPPPRWWCPPNGYPPPPTGPPGAANAGNIGVPSNPAGDGDSDSPPNAAGLSPSSITGLRIALALDDDVVSRPTASMSCGRKLAIGERCWEGYHDPPEMALPGLESPPSS